MSTSLIDVTRAEGLAALREEWGRLLDRVPANTIFLTWEWQHLWWRILGAKDGARLHVVAVRQGDDLIGLAPLAKLGEGATLHFSGGEEIADFLDILALPGHEAQVAGAVLDFLRGEEWSSYGEEWSSVELRNLREDSVGAAHLIPEARRRGLLVEVGQEDVSPWLRLPESWDAYQQSLSKKDRHELRRKLRRLHSAGDVRWYLADDPDRRESDVADFIRLHRLSDESKAEFMTSDMEGWFRGIVEQFAPARKLRLYFLELDGLRVASAICFDYGNQFLLYNSGYDPECARLSVGLALKAYCIHDAIVAGREVFDFLQGSEPYKYDLGAVDKPIYRARIRRA